MLTIKDRPVKIAALALSFADWALEAAEKEAAGGDICAIQDARSVIGLVLAMTDTPRCQIEFLDLEVSARCRPLHFLPGLQTAHFLYEVAVAHVGECASSTIIDGLQTILRFGRDMIGGIVIGKIRDDDAIFGRLSRASGGIDFRPAAWSETWADAFVLNSFE